MTIEVQLFPHLAPGVVSSAPRVLTIADPNVAEGFAQAKRVLRGFGAHAIPFVTSP